MGGSERIDRFKLIQSNRATGQIHDAGADDACIA